MGWIETSSGTNLSVEEPKHEDIDINDIAHSLSMQCRFNGHCREFYSVAQHSVHVMDCVAANGGDLMAQRCALLHDAAEAYVGDLTRPIKAIGDIGILFHEVESRFMAAIGTKFELHWTEEREAQVKIADDTLLATEARDLFTTKGAKWGLRETPIEDLRIVGLSPTQAKEAFLRAFSRVRA